MALKLTEAQRLAIETTNQSIVLSAGAGSGKTRVLVQRYLYILEQRLATAEQILAITFTNKAAGEMKERIQREIFKHTLQATTDIEKEFWRKVKEEMNHAQISTFHSFCGQVLRQHPLEAKIDPYFRVLEEIEAGQLLNDSIEEILLTGLEVSQPELVTIVREFSIRSINQLLRMTYLQSRGYSLKEIATNTHKKLKESSVKLAELKAEICELVEELLHILHTEKLSASTTAKLEELEAFWNSAADSIANLQKFADPERKVLIKITNILKGNVATAVKERINRLKIICSEEIDQYLADQRMSELIDPLVHVLQQIDQKYREKKRNLNSMDFEDLQELTIRVFEDNPQLVAQYQEKYKFVMVDEFQDTNPIQETLIRLIIGGSKDAVITGNKLFIVGDPKQSIYRFRGADVTIFKQLNKEILEHGGQEILMHKNFRSREKVITFINHCFDRIFGTSDSRYDMPYQASEYARTCEPQECCVEFMLLDRAELKEEEVENRDEEANQLALRIQQMVLGGEKLVFTQKGEQEIARPVEYGDICILFQALTHIQTYEEALQRYHIPYTVVNGRGFFERPEIQDLLNLLKLVDNHQREIEWVGVLRSPLVGLSDEELYWLAEGGEPFSRLMSSLDGLTELRSESFNRLQQFVSVFHDAWENRERKAISLLLNELLNRTGYWELTLAHPYTELVRANITKFIGMIRTYEQNALVSLSGFIKYIEGLKEAEAREGMAQIPGEENLVKLMSVHQSKGLEFPVLIVPDIQRKLINPAVFPNIIFDPTIGIGMRLRDLVFGGSVPSSLHAAIWEEEKRREIAERKRNFYVAATRARDYLLISGTGKKFKTTEIDEAASWFEWLGLVFGFQTPDQIPVELFYGEEGQYQIKVRQRQTDLDFAETAVTTGVEATQLEDKINWSDLYHSPAILPIKPRGKSGYNEFSVTELLTYAKCPRWYYYQYIEHLPTFLATPLQNLKLDEDDSIFHDAAKRGTLIHFLCERFTNHSELSDLVKRGMYNLGLKNLTQPEQIKRVIADVQPDLDVFLQKESEIQQYYGDKLISDQRESAFSLILGKSLIQGTIDRLLCTPEYIHIIDYKSNRLKKQEISRVLQQYSLQMDIYALAAFELTGQSQIRCSLHFLVPNEVIEFNYSLNEFTKIRAKVQQLTSGIIDSIREGVVAPNGIEEFFPCVSAIDDCPYQEFCAYLSLCRSAISNDLERS